jgi:hypothetical protein
VRSNAIPASSGYAELAREIRRLGLQRRRLGFYTVLLIANLMALGGVAAAMTLLRDSWWLMLLAVALAIVSAQISSSDTTSATTRQPASVCRRRCSAC